MAKQEQILKIEPSIELSFTGRDGRIIIVQLSVLFLMLTWSLVYLKGIYFYMFKRSVPSSSIVNYVVDEPIGSQGVL